MRLKEVLNKIPGLTKGDLQYWETRGYISPVHVSKKRISRRDYALAFEKIRIMWGFYKQGSSPEEASRLADRAMYERGGFAFSSFFKVVKETSAVAKDFCDASLMEIGSLNAPGDKQPEPRLVFASMSMHLASAARKMVPHLSDMDFVIAGDKLGALLMGACSMAISEIGPSKSPLLLERDDLDLALSEGLMREDGRACLVFGFLKELGDIEDVQGKLGSQKVKLECVVSLASEVESEAVRGLKLEGLRIVSLFDNDEVERAFSEFEEKG